MKFSTVASMIVGALSLVACATAAPPIGSTFHAPNASASVVIMPPEATVTFITTGGPEQRADWSEQVKANLLTALQSELQSSGERIELYDPAQHQSDEAQQALLLNQAVTDTLAAHVVFMDVATFRGRLPHQATQRETYTLGESVHALMGDTNADYALFITSHSQIESSGVFMRDVLIAMATGYAPASANFRGTYISLVDIRTGDVVWLRSWNMGDPRNPAEAASIVDQILKDGPFSTAAQ